MEAWNQTWQTDEGRREWLTPEPFIIQVIPELHSSGVRRVLDLGFGVGRHTIALAQAGFEVFGLEAAENGLAYAEEWANRAGVDVKLTTGNMANLPYPSQNFDAILTWNVIYHGYINDIHHTVAEIERCLVPQGHLICSLISTRNERYGKGIEVEPHTFVIPDNGETEHPHHYSDRAAIDEFLHNFDLLRCEDVPRKREDDYHWHIWARRQV